jgi:hypothetical protein
MSQPAGGFPARYEVEERGGADVLVDDGELEDWRSLFVPDSS